MIRKACIRKGHKFRDVTGVQAIPYVYCARWFCKAEAVAIWAPRSIAAILHNGIPDDRRYPPEKIDVDQLRNVEPPKDDDEVINYDPEETTP